MGAAPHTSQPPALTLRVASGPDHRESKRAGEQLRPLRRWDSFRERGSCGLIRNHAAHTAHPKARSREDGLRERWVLCASLPCLCAMEAGAQAASPCCPPSSRSMAPAQSCPDPPGCSWQQHPPGGRLSASECTAHSSGFVRSTAFVPNLLI